MARQRSIQKFSGTMGEVTYYKLDGKYYSRKKSTLSKEDVLTKKAFAGSRKASALFGKASTANRLIRSALMEGVPFSRITEIHNMLQPRIRKLITDAASSKKTFNLNQLAWEELKNFEFNKQVHLTNLALGLAEPKIATDASSGHITMEVNDCRAIGDIASLDPSVHFRILATAAQIDFGKKKVVKITASSSYLPVRSKDAQNIKLDLSLKTPIIHPLFITIGIVCYDNTNGAITEYLRADRLALKIIQVIPAPPPAKKKNAPKKKSPPKKKK